MGGTSVLEESSGDAVLTRVRQLAQAMAQERGERQRRRHLEPADFRKLADAGYLRTGVPEEQGGLWRGLQASVRLYSDLIYTIARGDPSVALVAAMHPTVLASWLAADAAPDTYADVWAAQRSFCFETALTGDWWGTITSEPGSGGDIMKTQAVAKPVARGGFQLSGDKHFGSGSGVAGFMITTARVEGAAAPTLFFLDVRKADWDGRGGMQLTSDWDGHGMSATQSHGFRFQDFPATAIAWPGAAQAGAAVTAQLAACLFTSVIVGIIDEAIATARRSLEPKREALRPYEQVEWTRVVNQAWTIGQVREGMIGAVENDRGGVAAASRGKAVIAELSEACLSNLSRVIGGGSFSRTAPYGQWAQDVRALGFLRPPWGLAFDQLYAMSWAD